MTDLLPCPWMEARMRDTDMIEAMARAIERFVRASPILRIDLIAPAAFTVVQPELDRLRALAASLAREGEDGELCKRLEIKADMIQLGEKIAYGSDSEIMREAAARIRTLAAENARLEELAYSRDTFDPSKRGPSYKDLEKAVRELAVEDTLASNERERVLTAENEALRRESNLYYASPRDRSAQEKLFERLHTAEALVAELREKVVDLTHREKVRSEAINRSLTDANERADAAQARADLAIKLFDQREEYLSGLIARNAELRENNARLRGALEPFAKRAERYDPDEADDGEPDWSTASPSIRIGDLRRARSELEGR